MTAVTGQAGPAGVTTGSAGRAGRAGPPGPAGPRGGRPGVPGAAAWRRWRAPATLVAIILVGGAVIAMLQAGPAVSGPLDPRDVGPAGTHALAALLAGQGKQVSTVDTAAAALARAGGPHTALVIADPGLVGRSSLPALAATSADLLIVAPGPHVLGTLTPGVTQAARAPVASRPPQCAWPGARLAGPADMGGLLLRSTEPGAWRCYPDAGVGRGGPPRAGHASLVRYQSDGRIITVLGTGAPLTNRALGSGGNAALALNLLAGDSHIVWLVPGPVVSTGPGSRSIPALIPGPFYLVIAELAVALALAALWRARRFGPLVFEPLPVAVRASETAEGHGRLYRSRRARGRAAAALRAASVARIITRTGLPPAASPEVICQKLADRTGLADQEIRAVLFGPAPGDDAALVKLAADLDTLEGQVLTQ